MMISHGDTSPLLFQGFKILVILPKHKQTTINMGPVNIPPNLTILFCSVLSELHYRQTNLSNMEFYNLSVQCLHLAVILAGFFTANMGQIYLPGASNRESILFVCTHIKLYQISIFSCSVCGMLKGFSPVVSSLRMQRIFGA